MAQGVVTLLYLNLFLLVGVLLRHFFRRISAIIPYTVSAARLGAAGRDRMHSAQGRARARASPRARCPAHTAFCPAA